MLNCEMSFDSRMTVIGSGVLPERCRVNIPREIGASISSNTSGDSIGVSGPGRKRIFCDTADGGVDGVLEVSRRGELVDGPSPGVEGV